MQDENGTPVYDTFVGDVIERYAVAGYPVHDQTEALLNFLRDNKVTVIPVPFDWRLDLSTKDITNRIDDAINEALTASNGRQITIISHSTGGIVVRDYLIQNSGAAANVKISSISVGLI